MIVKEAMTYPSFMFKSIFAVQAFMIKNWVIHAKMKQNRSRFNLFLIKLQHLILIILI